MGDKAHIEQDFTLISVGLLHIMLPEWLLVSFGILYKSYWYMFLDHGFEIGCCNYSTRCLLKF